MTEIPQKCDFLTWSIQNFVRKVKQFVRNKLSHVLHLHFALLLEIFSTSFWMMTKSELTSIVCFPMKGGIEEGC